MAIVKGAGLVMKAIIEVSHLREVIACSLYRPVMHLITQRVRYRVQIWVCTQVKGQLNAAE